MERTIAPPSTQAPWAMRAENTHGRRFPEPEHPYRSVYARDRDRIIHARAFRRLEAKTQVFTTRYSIRWPPISSNLRSSACERQAFCRSMTCARRRNG
jgi:hypothetical protein